MSKNEVYDVALSFAGEDRTYVHHVANELRDQGVRVFYDKFEEAAFWGKDLYVYFSEVYSKRARFAVLFLSEAYKNKVWTNHERECAQARAFQQNEEYILPARFDETEIPGILPTTGYICLIDKSPKEFATIIIEKLINTGGTVPSKIVRNDLGAISKPLDVESQQFYLEVYDNESSPIVGGSVTMQADNGTIQCGKTDKDGRCCLEVQTRRLYRALIAHPYFPALIVEKVDPSCYVQYKLDKIDNVGSVIFDSTGYIPGLQGRLNPICDSLNRTYLYAENIAINGGKPQPTYFTINEPIELEDVRGTVVYVTVQYISGRVSLLQFSRYSPI